MALAVFFIAALPLVAGAAIDSPEKVISLTEKIRDYLFTFLIAIAVIMIIISAYLFLSSGGDPKGVETARNQLIYAVIAVVVAFLSRAIISIVHKLLQ